MRYIITTNAVKHLELEQIFQFFIKEMIVSIIFMSQLKMIEKLVNDKLNLRMLHYNLSRNSFDKQSVVQA